ncbi:MAG: 1-deoxy-D-xylulose-5-phosphate synthase, partial [Actinomycetia bacterium]|nr:1-deoxy-D-xylulose-5-phosphate synthase [Actinomycetes bacterium]
RQQLVVTIEDNVVRGGFGATLCHTLRDAGDSTEVLSLGLPAEFIATGERGPLLREYGLDARGIAQAISSRLAADA